VLKTDGSLVLVSLSGVQFAKGGTQVGEEFTSLRAELTAALGDPHGHSLTSATWRTEERTIELLATFDVSSGISVRISYD
jgi:hypothetical protein